jgi:hypothetical protein
VYFCAGEFPCVFNLKEKQMKTNELTGAALDWAVAKCEGRKDNDFGWWWDNYHPSTDWAQGGPIIAREAIQLTPDEYTQTWSAYTTNEGNPYECVGTTPLIAAMRCYVASKLGDEVEIPQELLREAT